MHRFIATVASLIVLTAIAAQAMNGHTATILWRWTGGNPSVPEMAIPGAGGNTPAPVGQLARVIIANNAVIRTDTIVRMTTAFCQYPALSVDGSRIAFIRWPKRVVNGQCVDIPGDSARIAVVDVNGSHLRDIVALPGRPGLDVSLDWPSDGWIYYVRPNACSGCDEYARNGSEIWKVNPYAANAASTNVKVFSIESCKYIRRFSASLTANRFAVQTYPYPGQDCSSDMNGALPLPSAGSLVTGTTLGNGGSCNAKISASGTIMGGYAGGAHTDVQLSRFDGSRFSESGWPMQPYCVEHTSIYGAYIWSGFDMGGSAGCEQLCFSSNSDKWYTTNVMWLYGGVRRGTNQLVLNWYDKQAIFATRNPKAPADPNYSGNPAPGSIGYQAFSGDLWVEPPSGFDYAYQDTAGTWHQLSKPSGWSRGDTALATPSAREISMRVPQRTRLQVSANRGIVRVVLPDGRTSEVRVLNTKGMLVCQATVRGQGEFSARRFKPGRYVVQAKNGVRTVSASLTVLD